MKTYDLEYIFFFQAEDGIRDKLVTGVQTCALPISTNASRIAVAAGIPTINAFFGRPVADELVRQHGKAALVTATNVFAHIEDINEIVERSEERRVGKECRSGRSPFQYHKSQELACR